jgi:integrase
LLLWTGARPEEVAQLLVEDFHQDAKTKRWMMTITDAGHHPEKGERSLKTESHGTGERTIPVPLKLVELGLVDYIDALREAGTKALFPDLKVKGERGLLFPSFGTWWGTYLRSNGIVLEGKGRRPAREFRDVWTTAARASEIARDARQYIQGHSTANLTANEDYGQHQPLGWQIDKWQLEGLDLTSVERWTKLEAAGREA